MASLDHGAERAVIGTVDCGFRAQVKPRSVHQRLRGEARPGRDHRMQRMSLRGEFRDDKSALALRAAPELAIVAIVAQASIADLYEPAELASCLTFGQRLHQLVFHPLGGAIPRGLSSVVAHARVPHQPQRRQVGLALGQQVRPTEAPEGERCHKPSAQRQLGAGEHDVDGLDWSGAGRPSIATSARHADSRSGCSVAGCSADRQIHSASARRNCAYAASLPYCAGKPASNRAGLNFGANQEICNYRSAEESLCFQLFD